MDEVLAHLPESGSPSHLLRLVAAGTASSRSDLVRLVRLAPSTVSARVEQLIADGYLRESGDGASRGGRRPRLLEVDPKGGLMLAADFGSKHVRLAAIDVAGRPLVVRELPWDLGRGPDETVKWLAERLGEIQAEPPCRGVPARGLGVGLPGPVDFRQGRVLLPSRMPGWHNVSIRTALADELGLPVVVDNDANLMAVGEHLVARPEAEHLVVVKLGAGIGCGIISSGHLHRGGAGAPGEISHVRVAAAGDTRCSCGNTGCLETVASGAAIVGSLAADGLKVKTIDDVLRLVQDGDPVATNRVRDAGRHLGEVLSVVVNFFNPEAIVLGGGLSEAQPLVAAVRAVVYERCLPLATQALEIDTARTGTEAGVIGAGLLVLQQTLATPPASVVPA